MFGDLHGDQGRGLFLMENLHIFEVICQSMQNFITIILIPNYYGENDHQGKLGINKNTKIYNSDILILKQKGWQIPTLSCNVFGVHRKIGFHPEIVWRYVIVLFLRARAIKSKPIIEYLAWIIAY